MGVATSRRGPAPPNDYRVPPVRQTVRVERRTLWLTLGVALLGTGVVLVVLSATAVKAAGAVLILGAVVIFSSAIFGWPAPSLHVPAERASTTFDFAPLVRFDLPLSEPADLPSPIDRREILRRRVTELRDKGYWLIRLERARLVDEAKTWQDNGFDLLYEALIDPMQSELFQSPGRVPLDTPPWAGLDGRIVQQTAALTALLARLDHLEIKDSWNP